MLGDYLNNNNRREVCTREGQVLYHGKKYSIEPETGYYVCTSDLNGNRKRLHVAIWEHEHGGVSVPPGCIIHHLDWNKKNNNINNLLCVTKLEHEKIHNIIGGERGKAYGYELQKVRGVSGIENL